VNLAVESIEETGDEPRFSRDVGIVGSLGNAGFHHRPTILGEWAHRGSENSGTGRHGAQAFRIADSGDDRLRQSRFRFARFRSIRLTIQGLTAQNASEI